MTILDTIIERKRTEVAERKIKMPIEALAASPVYSRDTISLAAALKDETKTGIIAEFKRKSPSKGIINDQADITDVTKAYARFGASGISVLTDTDFFGGSAADLLQARINQMPLLRKDFIIDEYQVHEARAMGADVILLIAACLEPAAVKYLASVAKNLGLEVLLEIHDETELGHICNETQLVGINNRDLKTFTVDIRRSIELSAKLPADKIRIAESGIDSVYTLLQFKQAGFSGFLVGELFMRAPDPAIAFERFVTELKTNSI